MAYKINTEYTDTSFISLEIVKVTKVYTDCYLITTSSYNQYFVNRTELETIRTTLSTALDKFKKL